MMRNKIQRFEEHFGFPRGTYGTHSFRSGGDARNRKAGFSIDTRSAMAGWNGLGPVFTYAKKAQSTLLVEIAQKELQTARANTYLINLKNREIKLLKKQAT
eukprot:296072_1